MKYILLIIVLFLCGLIGYILKEKYRQQKEFLEFMRSFVEYLHLNISIYKNNISEIINGYIINQKNKSAKYNKLFQNKAHKPVFNMEIIDYYIYNKDVGLVIKSFLIELGSGDGEFECKKIELFKSQLEDYISITNNELKTKGELAFKLWLAIGLIVDIILW